MKLIFRFFQKAVCLVPKLFAVSMLLALALTVMDTFMPWVLRLYLEQLTEQNSYALLGIGIALFALYLLAKVFLNIRWYVSLDEFGGKYIEKLSVSLERSLAESYYSEVEQIGTAVVRNILFTDVLNVFRVIGHHIPSMLSAAVMILACLIFSSVYSKATTLYILAAAIIGFLISWCSRKIVAKYAGQTNAKLKEHDRWCSQYVALLPLVQNHNILNYFQEKTGDNLEDFVKTAIAEDKKTLFWSGVAGSYHTLFSIFLSALLALPVSGNSIPDFAFFTMIAGLVMEQAQKVEMLFQQVMKQYISFVHVDRLQNLPHRAGQTPAEPIASIDFSSVSFSYTDKTAALREVSCGMRRGQIIHLSGANGSGKSTFIKLLTGLYRRTGGEILINGKDIESFSKESLNDQILYIDQDEQCLNEGFQTYIELITAQALDAERYQELISKVNLLDDGRVIQENGKSLSVGQRKKLMLLKLLLRMDSASVIILDELTAGLDADTTELVYGYIRQAAEKGDKIILVVDHNMPGSVHFTHSFHFQDGTVRICQE